MIDPAGTTWIVHSGPPGGNSRAPEQRQLAKSGGGEDMHDSCWTLVIRAASTAHGCTVHIGVVGPGVQPKHPEPGDSTHVRPPPMHSQVQAPSMQLQPDEGPVQIDEEPAGNGEPPQSPGAEQRAKPPLPDGPPA
jgi:hypothetical protein